MLNVVHWIVYFFGLIFVTNQLTLAETVVNTHTVQRPHRWAPSQPAERASSLFPCFNGKG